MSALPLSPERDYVAEMRHAIEQATATSPYSVPEVAASLVQRLRRADPDLLSGWLEAQAVPILSQWIREIDTRRRMHVRAVASRGVFADAAARAATGDTSAVAGFLSVAYTLPNGDRKPLRDFVKADLLATADLYASRAREQLMTDAFLRAIAAKVGAKTVGEKFTDEQLDRMWASLNRASQ